MSSTEVPLSEGLTRELLLHHRLCPSKLGADGALHVLATEDALLDAVDFTRRTKPDAVTADCASNC